MVILDPDINPASRLHPVLALVSQSNSSGDISVGGERASSFQEIPPFMGRKCTTWLVSTGRSV